MTLLDRLKTETRPAHDRIERAIDLERRLATRDAYRNLLIRFHGFHRSWEGAAAAALGDHSLFAPRRKEELLARDLAALGLDAREIEALPRCAPLMPLPSPAAALGSMYVVEGSSLGGTVIAREVERRLGLTAETGCAYFQGYGRGTAPMWRSFGAVLLAASSPDHDDVIVDSASRTFEVMRHWLCEAP